MLYQDILDSAIRMLGESDSNGNTSDYGERAIYLLATFCSDCASLDRKYRKLSGEPVEKIPLTLCVNLDDPFPLSDIFASAAVYYLASMLILEENEDICETLFERYTDSISSIRAELFAIQHTKNRYPLV